MYTGNIDKKETNLPKGTQPISDRTGSQIIVEVIYKHLLGAKLCVKGLTCLSHLILITEKIGIIIIWKHMIRCDYD